MPVVAGWSLLAIASVVAVVAGIVLLVAYALRRGLVHRELDGTTGPETDPRTVEAPAAPATGGRQPDGARTLGAAGALLLVIGLGLGLVTVIGGWSGAGTSVSGGPGVAPTDCAQSWQGCPQATP